MPSEEQISREFYDQVTTHPAGYRDKRGEWRPENPIRYPGLFEFKMKTMEFLQWLKGYLFPWNTIWFSLTLITWFFFQPSLETCRTFQPGWILYMFIRNQILLWAIFGGWHMYLYHFKKKGHDGKYSPRWQNTHGTTFLFKNQVQDNIFWTCVSGGGFWTAYEVITMWMYANGRLPYVDPKSSPVLFAVVLLLIPIWREFHFYWIHRLIHWKPLYDRIHYLHHYNINPGPWSGMAMHPIEHLLYFSVTLIHWVVPSHPLHFFFNAQHTALTPADSHSGFEGEVAGDHLDFGSYFHYLHHRHFDCNYGEATIPLDKWFGSFEDGSRTDSEKNEARRTYRQYRVKQIVEESPEVKSFYLVREDGEDLERVEPGQHLLFKLPAGKEGRTALRFYTLSDFGDPHTYRISVKCEEQGEGSRYLHEQVKEGDLLEARGPLGDFTPELFSSRPMVLVAGGIGITPILAMLKGTLAYKPKRIAHLFLSFRSEELAVFTKEIEDITAKYPQLRVTTRFTGGEQGRFTAQDLIQNVTSRKADIYLCGPDAMMQELTRGLTDLGIAEERIHTESFNQGKDGEDSSAVGQHEVTFLRSGKTFTWDNEYRNILEFAESNGITLDAGCMFGECGACATKVAEGEVTYNYNTATKPQPGQCLVCSCRPASKLTLDA